MNDFMFSERLSGRDYLVPVKRAGFLKFRDLASRVTIDAEDKLAHQLGDGKEADCKTNRPDSQTDPALFAAPHAFYDLPVSLS